MPPKIEHVIVLMLENRSFDHLFGFLDHPKKFNGLTGNESNPKYKTDPTPVSVYKGANTYNDPDPGHSHLEIMTQIDLGVGGKNDGFYSSYAEKITDKGGKSDPREVLGIFDTATPGKPGYIIAQLAKAYTLCDNWFSSVPGETWPNRNFAHAGTSDGEVNIKKKFYKNRTIFEEIAEHGLKWQIYHDGIAQAMVFYKLWFKRRFRSFDHFKKDVESDRLANYIFIEPLHFSLKGRSNSMHPANNRKDGDKDFIAAEALIAEIYNTLLANKNVFEKSVLLITFDEHGGFYDHEPPPTCVSPDGQIAVGGFDFKQYGIRVPAIIVSPHAKKAHIDSEEYDHSSIIRSVFQILDIDAHLQDRDKIAKSFLQSLTDEEPEYPLRPLTVHVPFEDNLAPKFMGFAEINEQNFDELNELQKDLLQMAENMQEVMADDELTVERNIALTGNRMYEDMAVKRFMPKAPLNIRQVENEFLARYGDNS